MSVGCQLSVHQSACLLVCSRLYLSVLSHLPTLVYACVHVPLSRPGAPLYHNITSMGALDGQGLEDTC